MRYTDKIERLLEIAAKYNNVPKELTIIKVLQREISKAQSLASQHGNNLIVNAYTVVDDDDQVSYTITINKKAGIADEDMQFIVECTNTLKNNKLGTKYIGDNSDAIKELSKYVSKVKTVLKIASKSFSKIC